MAKKEEIKDFRIEKDMTVKELIEKLNDSGFQASSLGKAYEIIKKMKKEDCKIYLSFTSILLILKLIVFTSL